MTDKDKLLKSVNDLGLKFPSRQRFVLNLIDDNLGIMTFENKSKIKLENEKVFSNKSYLISGAPTAIIDIVDCRNAEEYVDKLLELRKRWNLDNDNEN